jgi:DNA-binding beta-propeller fold protein YncE
VISDVVDHPPYYVYVGCSVGVVTASRTNGSVLATLSTPHPVNSLAVHPTRPLLYASATTAGRVYEIDADADALVRELPILGGPQGTVLPGGDEIDVAMEGEHQLEKWDLGVPAATDSLALSTVVNGAGPFDVALNAGGTRLLVSAGNFVMEVNRANLELTRKYWVGGTARRIGVADGVAVVANEGGWVDLLPF